jgi:glycosyltransferase involved in cell wall biosynthesis
VNADFREQVTPLVITYDEAANIERTLAALRWARRIVVVDSGSTDGTLETLARHPQVDVHHRRFDDFASQCNFGLTLVRTPWVLSLDADYVLTDGLQRELATLRGDDAMAGFAARFVYCVHGRPLSGTLYPPRVVLHRVAGAAYENTGHSHRVRVDGRVGRLHAPILHDDRKSLARWLDSQRRYARREAEYLLAAAAAGDPLKRTDRLRLNGWLAPLAALPYTLFAKRCLLDGWPGWLYALQRLHAEVLLAMELADRRAAARLDVAPATPRSARPSPAPRASAAPTTARTGRPARRARRDSPIRRSRHRPSRE